MSLWLNLHFIAPPYFDHDAFTHHALHVLQASEREMDLVTWVKTSFQAA